VDITPDLKQAHIFISALGTEGQKRGVIALLEKNRHILQAELAKRLILKQTPHLNFRLDDSIERGSRVLSILDELGLDETK
jgi:ribosome-binding factor A